ncbi:unnamed protein product [Victoria cruziana]
MEPLLRLTPTDVLLLAAFLLFVVHHVAYTRKKSAIPGPAFTLPFLGSALSMVLNPTRFWEQQAWMARSSPLGLSANFILGRFMVFIHDVDLSHRVFSNVSQDVIHLIGHPFGKKLFGEHNLIYLTDQEHKDIRRSIAPNFTPRALSAYTAAQQAVIRSHLRSWLALGSSSPISLRTRCRDMNLETSQTVFVGPYLDGEARDRFDADYTLFNSGLLALPIDLPGFAFRRARNAVSRLVDTLAACATRCRSNMSAGHQPRCLMDFWIQDIVSGSEGKLSDREIGGHVFDFLFAAQDASTSSLLWAISMLESHPDVLARVRAEQERVRPDPDAPISADQIAGMAYTRMVAKEVVRFRPPATLVPHIAACDFPISDGYTVPKGSILFPSLLEAASQGFSDPDRFDPDRFSEERREDETHKRSWLMFGSGPHQCVGQRYALNHLVLFIALFVTECDFKRARSDGCDDIAYKPTIVPKDDCLVYLSPRTKATP